MKKPPALLKATNFFATLDALFEIKGQSYKPFTGFWRNVERLHKSRQRQWQAFCNEQNRLKNLTPPNGPQFWSILRDLGLVRSTDYKRITSLNRLINNIQSRRNKSISSQERPRVHT